MHRSILSFFNIHPINPIKIKMRYRAKRISAVQITSLFKSCMTAWYPFLSAFYWALCFLLKDIRQHLLTQGISLPIAFFSLRP
ncbi:hypothetical protein HHE03_12370 [Helicobacter heilmannii]|nr:hypothetical protein HHE014_10080 [Helicobacter heilmannii]CRF49611.1 hypothetical protein HHE03_12370 [Helicobacter heilmannii]